MYGAAYNHCFQANVCGLELSLRLLSLLENINKNSSCFNNRYLVEEDLFKTFSVIGMEEILTLINSTMIKYFIQLTVVHHMPCIFSG